MLRTMRSAFQHNLPSKHIQTSWADRHFSNQEQVLGSFSARKVDISQSCVCFLVGKDLIGLNSCQ